jgi:hypothetical protein
MYAARVVIVLILILTTVVAYNPRAREQAATAVEKIGPAVWAFIDSFYVAVQSLINHNASEDRIDEMPVPGPGGDFERIVTRNSGFSF